MNSVCFLTSLPLSKIEYGYLLYKSFTRFNLHLQADLIFLFDDEVQKDFFECKKKISVAEVIKSDINSIYKDVSVDRLSETEKKFMVLRSLAEQYRFIVTVEPDSIFIRNVDLLGICYKFYTDKILLGNSTVSNPDIDKIKQSCKSVFVNPKIGSDGIFDSLYLWMNNLCIYDTALLSDFFQKIGFPTSRQNYSFWGFDFYIFMYYLLLYRGFMTVDLMYRGYAGFCEETSPLADKKFIINDYLRRKINLCTGPNLNFLNNDNLFLLIHLDRTRNFVYDNLLK